MLGFPRPLGNASHWPQFIDLDSRKSRFLQTLGPNTLANGPALLLPKAVLGTWNPAWLWLILGTAVTP